jgi:uncharacterized repeat protein (TIGR01451 family)
MKQIFFFFAIVFCMTNTMRAQVNAIPFSQSIDTFQYINGTIVDAPNEDDIFHDNLPIGFNFIYNGNTTDKFGVCTNGFIVLDSLMHSGFWNLNVNSTNQINVLFGDLRNTNIGGSIEYVTIGTAPNRVCIIQWRDYDMFGNPYCHLNAQIRLFETSNCIQLYYGNNALSGNTGKIFHVGLIGDTVSDFNLRTTNTNWVNSSVSTTFPGDGMLLNPLINLPSGLVFSFGNCPPTGVQFSYISGKVYNDINNNGVKEVGEEGIANVLIHELSQNMYASTDSSGQYALFFVDSNATYTLTAIPMMYWNISTTPATYTITPINQATNNRDFGLYATPNIHDVTVTTLAGSVPWPNANVSFYTTFHNNGTVIESGDSLFLVKDSHYSFLNSTPAPDYISGDSIVWIYTNLLINEYRNINLLMHADTLITMGDTLHSYWTIKPIAGDVAPSNNYFAKHQPCLAAFDPNSKEVSPDGNIENTDELSYTIHFQNTGTAPALNVFLHDTLDANLDVSTFKIVAYSHPMTHSISGSGNLLFTFANINLPDSNANEPASHGAVSYTIKPKAGLAVGSTIHNTAAIVFDYNLPIITNTTQNIIIENIPNTLHSVNKQDDGITFYPNPAGNSINIESNTILKDANVLIYDMTGKIVFKQTIKQTKQATLNVSALNNGMYILEVIHDQYTTQKKLIKR